MALKRFPVLPALVAHADWSIHPRKRWMACAELRNGTYTAHKPENAVEAENLLRQLHARSGGGGPKLVGFDFPIGLPVAYASKAGISDFLSWLPMLGRGEWVDFDRVASTREEISIQRPFYPNAPGGTRQRFLLDALNVEKIDDLRRGCERQHALTRAASPLFWTMGPNQVGKAALSGWSEMLVPALRSEKADIAIWPFTGDLAPLLSNYQMVITETYPAEMYHHLGISWPNLGIGIPSGKRSQRARKRNAGALLGWAQAQKVALDPALVETIHDGFGSKPDGEDKFDAAVGLLGMLNVLMGGRLLDEPKDERTRRVEGWIFGRAAEG